jgi:hypothetical protein
MPTKRQSSTETLVTSCCVKIHHINKPKHAWIDCQAVEASSNEVGLPISNNRKKIDNKSSLHHWLDCKQGI